MAIPLMGLPFVNIDKQTQEIRDVGIELKKQQITAQIEASKPVPVTVPPPAPIVVQTAPIAPKPAPVAPTGTCGELSNRLLGLGVAQSDIQYAIFIASKESGCKSSAVNKSSGACGEFQSLPCGKWGAPGTDQYLLKAIQYAQSRYGGWQGAHTAWISKHWW